MQSVRAEKRRAAIVQQIAVDLKALQPASKKKFDPYVLIETNAEILYLMGFRNKHALVARDILIDAYKAAFTCTDQETEIIGILYDFFNEKKIMQEFSLAYSVYRFLKSFVKKRD